MANPIDIAAAKAKAMEKSLDARRSGLVGVFQTLAKQHGEASALIERVKNNPDKREALWPRIRVELLSHEKAELKAVYPALGIHSDLREYVEQHGREAKELEQMIDRLETTSMDAAEWMSLFDTLGDTVLAHAHEEETEIFPSALETIGHDQAKKLDKDFAAAQKAIGSSLTKH